MKNEAKNMKAVKKEAQHSLLLSTQSGKRKVPRRGAL